MTTIAAKKSRAGPGRPPAYEWNHWRRLYIRGGDDVTLEHLAALNDAPSLRQLERRSSSEDWTNLRAEFRRQVDGETRKLDALVASEIRARQARLGRAGQALVARALGHIDPRALAANPQAVARVAQVFAEMERRAAGIDVNKHEVTGADGGPIEVTDAKSQLLDRLGALVAAGEEGAGDGDPP